MSLRDHRLQEAVRQLHESGDVDLDHFILFLPAAFRKTPGISEARIVDQYINGQSLLLCIIKYSLGSVLKRENHGTDKDPDSIFFLQLLLEGIQFPFTAGDQDQIILFPGQDLREFKAQPAGSSCDNYEYKDGLTVGNRVYDKLIYEYRK